MKIIKVSSLDHAFGPKLMDSFQKNGLNNPLLTLFALEFLKRFERLDASTNFKELLEEPLTKIMTEINDELLVNKSIIEQMTNYRRVGDFCLYTLTFRNGFITKTIQDSDYCVSFGTNAYKTIGDWLKSKGELYEQLGTPKIFKKVSKTIKEVTQQ